MQIFGLCALWLVVALATRVAAQETPGDARARLTDGVESVATAGIPGPVSVYGDHAFAVIAGKQDDGSLLPVVAAAEWGQGRVVAFGHGGMIGEGSLGNAGTTAFVLNAVRWLGSADTPQVLVVRNDGIAAVLTGAGMKVRTVRTLSGESLHGTGVLIIDAHNLQENNIEQVRSFVTGGGGLMTVGLGWGWLQLHPGKNIHDHPGNRLLRDAGLAWCDGTLDPTGEGCFVVQALPATVHARAALDALSAEGATPDPQAGAAVTAAVRVMPEQDPLFAEATGLLEAHAGELVLSEQSPMKPKDGIQRALLALQVEMEKRSRPSAIRAHPSAAFFPGSVRADAPRVSVTRDLDLSRSEWHSTGLYAPPGEVVTISVDALSDGLRVRIGCHTDQLWHHKDWKRVPDIARDWAVGPGKTSTASAFGGLVYIEVPRGRSGVARVTIGGVVEAPRFVLGSTTHDAWLVSRSSPAPWGELESGKVIVSVPSEHLRTLDDPTQVMQLWDRISDAHATLATIPLQPQRPHRYVADVQISAGYMHSGYPIMTHLDAAEDMVRFDRLSKGCWGLLHELGHNHQEDDWTFDGTGEVTCNLFALHAIDTVCTPQPGNRGHPGVNTPPSLKAYLTDGAKFEQWNRDPFLALHMYVQLQRAFGWETFQRVFAEYRSLPDDQRPSTDDEKRDQWMVRFSNACGKNLGPFFTAWGVPTSESARQSIADLPGWTPEGFGE